MQFGKLQQQMKDKAKASPSRIRRVITGGKAS